MTPTVSVIICGYQQREFLHCAVNSVLRQTYQDFEVILIDNGSTDGSADICAGFETMDGKVRVLLSETNISRSRLLNAAIQIARGEFISLLYADDYYLPTKLATQIAAFRRLGESCGVVYSPGYRERDGHHRTLDRTLSVSGFVLRDMLTKHETEGFINPISPLVRKEAFLDFPFDEDLPRQGEGLYMRMALKYQFRFLPEPLVVMREHANNMGKDVQANTETAIIELGRLINHRLFPKSLEMDAKRFASYLYSRSAWLAIRQCGNPALAREYVQCAIALDKKRALKWRTLAALAASYLPTPIVRQLRCASS